ncbi:alpha/beta hydrolase [Streptomyces sp. 7N604]|uniref:alpha/beta hydrolase n=1 Tax=Streptomyces sp. 7N604 TaxID=3457415 RepID=UPI003FD34CED
MRIRRIAPLLAAGVMATLVPGLAPARAAAAEPLERYHQQKPAWHRCDSSSPAEYQCATIKVPLDYRRPAGKKINLAVSRIRTSVAGKRHGVMLFNPGGPGGEGLSQPLVKKSMLPEAVRDQYDLIGFDPRGVGRSSPITCGLSTEEQNWLRPYQPDTFGRNVAWARTVAKKCRARAGDRLQHITTRNTVRDMDVIRSVLGEKKISYLGTSYGTYLGAVYTQMFPDRADRFVLDSAVDPGRVWRGMVQVWASGAEPAFTRWTEWTARRDSVYRLGDTPAEVRKTFWDLVALADREPIEYEGEKLTGDDIRTMRGVFFSPRSAAKVVADLKKAADGRTGDRNSSAPAGPDDEVPKDNSLAAFFSVVCGDTSAWPRDPEQYRRDAIREKARYPLFGDFASNIMPCAFWNKAAEPVTTVDNTVGVLTVQNQWDSQTPLSSGRGMHRALKGSRMVYVAGGEGHGVYSEDPRACANRAVNAYLSTGELPAGDVTCRATSDRNRDAGDRRPGTTPPRVPGAPDRF